MIHLDFSAQLLGQSTKPWRERVSVTVTACVSTLTKARGPLLHLSRYRKQSQAKIPLPDDVKRDFTKHMRLPILSWGDFLFPASPS